MLSGCWTWELSQVQILKSDPVLSDIPCLSINLSLLHQASIHFNKQIKAIKRILQKIFLQEKKDYFNSIQIELFEFYFKPLIDYSNSSSAAKSAFYSVHIHWNRNLIKKLVEVSNQRGHLID